MPLVLAPSRLPRKVLDELHRELREELAETLETVSHPRGAVRDPTSLETAAELVRASLTVLEAQRERDAGALAAEANLAYAAMLAAIDLVKSHTDVPFVPRPRSDARTP